MALEWIKISGLLCMFGFLREIRPSEPYITEFLLGEWRNITQDQVNRELYPLGTYSYLSQLVVVFLITDFLRYKPLIIAMGVAGIIVWSLLLWTTEMAGLIVVELFYGTYLATEVAYYTYIYAKVEKKYYPRVTAHTRAAMFAGKLVAGALAQMLVNYQLMDYRELNYITLGAQIAATLWAFGLPPVGRSLYFHRESLSPPLKGGGGGDTTTTTTQHLDSRQASNGSNKVQTGSVIGLCAAEADDQGTIGVDVVDFESPSGDTHTPKGGGACMEEEVAAKTSLTKPTTPFQLLWQHFRNAYTNLKVVQWSIWYAVGLCGYMQVMSYVQLVWKEIEPDPTIAWNGAVDAILTGLAALSALAAGYLHAGRLQPRTSLLVLAALAALEGGATLLCCWTTDIYLSYTGYVIFGVLYAFTITVASAEVARYLEEDSFGLVFGINTLFALVLQTILTVVVVSEQGFALTAIGQYTVYGFYFITIAAMYFVAVLIEYCVYKRRESSYAVS